MSKFYGTVIEQATTPATRCGSRKSGIRTAAQSYDGSVIVELNYNDNDELMVQVEFARGTSFYGQSIFYGTFDEFVDKMTKRCFM